MIQIKWDFDKVIIFADETSSYNINIKIRWHVIFAPQKSLDDNVAHDKIANDISARWIYRPTTKSPLYFSYLLWVIGFGGGGGGNFVMGNFINGH